jgi:dipeptidyl aminopeptidase/acylaminoacyl peptidase
MVSYRARDGASISARIFLPAIKQHRPLPAVLFTGADSGDTDTLGFGWLAQFLAARGYVVIEPQYRGFGGNDSWFNSIGFKGWRTSVEDIAAATEYAVSQGIADPGRLAIIGWSHGGYAALLAAEGSPSTYKAVVAIAPITDLKAYKDDWAAYTSGKRIADAVGSAAIDGSPVQGAAHIQSPVLLIHGTLDYDERVTQSRLMEHALQKADKQSELLELNGLDRDLEDGDARTQMLLKIGKLLERTIGH